MGRTGKSPQNPKTRSGPAALTALLVRVLLGFGLLTGLPAAPASAEADLPRTRLQVMGGLAGVSQYTRFEQPFWAQRLPELTGGRVTADIAPFDRSGIRGQEALRLLRLGVTPFGTALSAVVAPEEPELSALELPGAAPDIAAHRAVQAAHRPWLESLLRERHGTELLAVYTYPAQVIFCARPFASLADLRGRRIRTSAAAQSEWVAAIGAVPVVTPFAEIVSAIRNGVVECAITGTMSGWQIGLNEVTTHVHAMAISWGLSLFGANTTAWENLPAALRDLLRRELRDLEARIWEAADTETGTGFACLTGTDRCTPDLMETPGGARRTRGRMTLVAVSPADEALRRRVIEDVVLPRWADRCGVGCVEEWNARVGAALGLSAPRPR
ncbi:TRAP transporter substrate-binding protein [Muricoccus radiodurans]|uniref:TRAP transporter substrate-binding protein n=1 Tax=Muricoccus radiodurans TaxID=2231721 RepID=UPI003CF4485D